MRFFPPDVESRMDKFLFILACKNQGNGKINLIKDLVKDLAIGAVVLKVFNINEYWLLLLVGILYIIVEIAFGWFLIHKHVIIREGSMSNKLTNPELIKLVKKDEPTNH